MDPLLSRDAKSELDGLRERQTLLILLFAFLLGLRALNSYLDSPSFPDLKRPPGPRQVTLSGKEHRPVLSPRDNGRFAPVEKKLPVVPLDINIATREELMTLPGIGPVLAERIVAYREEKGPFAEISEIKEVSGIGEKRFEKIKDWIRTR